MPSTDFEINLNNKPLWKVFCGCSYKYNISFNVIYVSEHKIHELRKFIGEINGFFLI